MKKTLYLLNLTLILLFSLPIYSQTTYTKVTSASGLIAGEQYLIIAHHDDYGVLAMGYQKTNNRHAVVVSEIGNSITVSPGTDPNSETDVFQFTLGGDAGAWTFFDEVKGGYLYAASSSSNNLKTQTELDPNGQWSITFNADGTAEVVAQGENTRNNMRFNPNTSNNSPMFCCYAETSSIDTRVSFYKEGGSVQPAPEPTNYPTNFTATVNGRDVTLTWNDALGGQLPHKYLVIGSIGNITVPTDGTPLPDGNMIRNVDYGVQSVTFSNLDSNTTYHFAIFPYTNSGAYIDYKSNGNYPTTNATTEDITVLLFEDFDESLGVFTTYSAYGEQVWHQASYQGITYANMNGYANGVANANEDWLISPAINKTGFSDVFVKFSTAMKFEWMPLRVMISTNYNGQSAPNNYDWQDITGLFNYSTGNYEWVESGRISVGIPSNTFYLAYVYTSNTTNTPSWEIDFVSIEALSNSANYYTITATANPITGGSVSGGGTYAQGSTCTLRAIPNNGYTFINWLENGTPVSTNATYPFTVTGNRNLVAVFDVATTYYTINVSANPTNGGSVSGGGSYASGSTCTLHATANNGYTFVNWTKNGTQVSTNPNYSFTVSGNASYVAHFQQNPTNYTITASVNPSNAGIITGTGTYASGSTCTLSATPNNNYTFVNWTKNGTVVSSNPNYSFIVTGDASFVANFEQEPIEYTITLNAEPANGGTVSGGGTYTEGYTCVISAMPNTGYVFERWTRNGTEVSTNPTYSFVVNRNATFVAHFTQNSNQATITANADPVEGGAVSGGGTYELGSICTLNAIAFAGYEFVNWTLNGNQVSTEALFSFTVTSNAVYVAHFNKLVNNYTVTVSLEPSSAGSVIGAGTYEEGTSCTLIAIANPTYSFVSWTENGAVVSTDDHYSFTVNRNRNLVAVFSQGLFYTINASAGANGTITPEGEVIVEPGVDKTFAIIPDNGCIVSKVLIDGIDIGPVESYTFRSVNANHSIRAQFSGLGVDDNINLDLKVYPNPANDIINVESQNMKRVSIFNLYGVQIESKEVNNDHSVFSTDNLSQGTYILKVESHDGRIGFTRFILLK